MTILHYILISVAILLQAIGAYGFLRKRLNFRRYIYGFTLIPVWIFSLGVLPLVNITLSPIGTIITAIYIIAGSTFIAYLIIRFAEKKQH